MMTFYRFIIGAIFVFLCVNVNASKNILEYYPIVISTSSDQNIFPKSWLEHDINAHAIPLSESEFSRTKSVLKKAFSKYPSYLLNKTLDTVYVVGWLKFNGLSASGTNSNRNIYLANRGIENGHTNLFMERAFHEELSSILLRNNPQYIDKKHWMNINPRSFKYGKTGVDAIKKEKASQVKDIDNYAMGFLTEYTTSSYENDFNSVARSIFLGDEFFWDTVAEYPLLMKKLRLVVDFYTSVDPRFTLNYFKGL